MASIIKITGPSHLEGKVVLPGSKSISNRVLIIESLCEASFEIENLSSSKDTQTLKHLLNSEAPILDCGHAGTTYRFMTALLAFRNRGQILTGSERMKERPIGPLVDALRSIGANISYTEKEGFPPLKFEAPKSDLKTQVEIDASMSSQYVSALMLIAPSLANGLEIILKGEVVSRAYINMTDKLMQHFDVHCDIKEDTIKIPNGSYSSKKITVEGDWSSASYLLGLAAIAESASLTLSPLFENSIQGDSIVSSILKKFGVDSNFENGNLQLSKSSKNIDYLEYDFINQPDLAQGIAVVCATKGIKAKLTGLQTLRIKETDRISALKIELDKVGITITPNENEDAFSLTGKIKLDKTPRFKTYEDHRMAMALSQISLVNPIEIENPNVVIKSFPNYWEALSELGFSITNSFVES